jgi:cytochrome c oxidase subunit 3
MATETFEARLPAGRPTVDRPGGPSGRGPFRDGGEGGRPENGFDPAHFGLWLFLGTVTMLFIGFTSAYIVRRTSLDWRSLPLPQLLWWNTAALLLSSATLETARRRGKGLGSSAVRPWLAATGVLAVLFVAGQVQAWNVMAARGFFLSSNPHSSFFYLLSGVHLLHLAGGLGWFVLLLSSLRSAARAGRASGALSLFATYWHFLAMLWVYVLVLVFAF